jgi:hypothetical protein
MLGRSVLLVAASLLLAGCTVLHSSTQESDGGIAYYLPKSVIVAKIDVTRRLKPEVKEGKSDSDYEYIVNFNTEGTGSEKATRGDTVPDLNQRFQLTYTQNPFFNDRYCVLTSPSNLLQSIEYATEDATPRIALALAELGRKAGRFVRRDEEEEARRADETYGSVIVTFDPFNDKDREAAEQVIYRTFNHNVKVRFDFPDLDYLQPNPKNKCRGDRGVCFRTKIKTPMLLRDANSEAFGKPKSKAKGKALTTIVLVDVVNPHYTGYFDLDRAFMVEKIVRLKFDDGALSQVIMRKPSEVLQTVKLPLAVVDTILAVPANFIANASGASGSIATELASQRKAIGDIEAELAKTGALGATSFNAAPYQHKCEGRSFNKS